MGSKIVKLLDERMPIAINQDTYRLIKSFCLGFETRDAHPYALNTAYLGLHKIQFSIVDRNMLFDIFYSSGSTEAMKELKKLTTSSGFRNMKFNDKASEMKILFKDVDEVDENRETQSDVFNIFCIYIIHKVHNSSLPTNIKTDYIFCVLKLLQYRFFTSLIWRRFKYGANEAVMRSTVDGLSNKFAIVQYGTWKKLIEARATEFYTSGSVHYKTITHASDDKSLLYVISDLQTRLRNQINIITSRYYTAHADEEAIKSYSLTGSDLDGEKILLDQKNVFENMSIGLTKELYVLNNFIDNELVSLMCKLYANITENSFKLILRKLSIKVVEQAKSKSPDKGGVDEVRKTGDIEIYIGMHAYVKNLILHTYRFCVLNKVPLNSKLAILKAVKDVYGSSRVANSEILSVKDSTELLVMACGASRRAATLASLKLAVITYFIVKSFKYI